MIADMVTNKRFCPIVTELFIRGRKLNFSTAFITKSNFQVPEDIPNQLELRNITYNNSSDINFEDFMDLNKKYTAKPYSFSVTDTTLASDNPLCFREIF